ncbi:MAG TPA: substrate-binding domain-containing protein [Polyangia bacterium]|nr:substrate-binding domain-containing protein [Polyangia bacterium]
MTAPTRLLRASLLWSVWVVAASCQRLGGSGDLSSSSSSSSQSPSSSPGLASSPVIGGDAGPVVGKRIRIGMIAKSSSNPVFLSARAGAEAAARDQSVKLGFPVQIVWLTPPREDAEVQAQRIGQAIKEKLDAILISCSDDVRLTPAIDEAVSKNIPVMTFDSDAPRSHRFAYFGVDDRRFGATVMAELAKLIHGKGKIAILAGNQSAPNLRKRIEGVKEEAARYPHVDIVGTFFHPETPEDAAAEVLRVMAAYPELRGWAMVGGWALFSKTLLDDPALQKIKIVAVDGLPPELRYVEKKVVPVLIAQPTFLWGNVGVMKILDRIQSGKDVTALIPMEPVKITVENLGDWARQLKQWGFADVPEEYLNLK